MNVEETSEDGLVNRAEQRADRMADVLVFSLRRVPAGELIAKAARDQYREGHAERMLRIRRLALAELERLERERNPGGAGVD